MTSRGMNEEDFVRIAGLVDRCIGVVKSVQGNLPKGENKLKDFKAKVQGGEVKEILEMREEVRSWARTFPLPVNGVDA